LQNLIGNAIKYHGAQPPRVHVSASHEAGEWLFSVADNGIGIEPAYQANIFRVFERLHASEAYPGTGIGLAIVRRGTERMGGRVGLESTPGQGTAFWIELPRGRAADDGS
jgi:signal transduction histidine kinase